MISQCTLQSAFNNTTVKDVCYECSNPVCSVVFCTMQVSEDPHAGIAWVSGEGQMYCISQGFAALLGYSFQDLRRNLQSLGKCYRHRVRHCSRPVICVWSTLHAAC